LILNNPPAAGHDIKDKPMKTRTRLTSLLLTALTLAASATTALAHDDATLDAMKSVYGGQVRMAGIHHFELVVAKDAKTAKENPVLVYVSDHTGKKIATAGASGTATLLAGKQKTSVTLNPDGDNRLKGMASYAATPDLKVVLAITLPGQPPEQARFTPLAAAKDGHTDHTH
jgi:hypothetical protein